MSIKCLKMEGPPGQRARGGHQLDLNLKEEMLALQAHVIVNEACSMLQPQADSGNGCTELVELLFRMRC
jgi:hypothetical protein